MRLIEQYDTVWLDTSVACADFIPGIQKIPWHAMRLDRIMYGSDYPNIPYAWDREIKQLMAAELSEENRIRLFKENAMQFFDIAEADLQQDASGMPNGSASRNAAG
jgi:predicted TIM-barrel fold metal-dependent hydrolase